ncbi:uncharacterized protein C8orf88 homolog isoform 2-T7 [Synchiropus picturatus]
MDVSRKRHFQKHLEPARPLRRCTPVDVQAMKTGLEQTPVMDCKITPEQFFRIINLNKPAERLCYSRDFLMSLASCAEARQKPHYLPQHPVVLSQAREELYAQVTVHSSKSSFPSEGAGC